MYTDKLGNKCLECGAEVKTGNKKSISMHLSRKHKEIDLQAYVLKHFYENKYPLCKCGCYQPVSWHVAKKEFNKYINGHNNQFDSDNQPKLSPIQIENRNKSIRKKYNTISKKNLIDVNKLQFKVLLINALGNSKVEGYTNCLICNQILKNNKRSLSSHLKTHSEEDVNFYYHKIKNDSRQFKLKCNECDEFVANSNNVLSRHLFKYHNMSWYEYVLKWEHGNEIPLCRCGCKEPSPFGKRGFKQYIVGHNSKGKLNAMHGLKGKKNPNFGKTRTTLMKEKYRQAAHKRYEDNPELIEKVRKRTIERNLKGEFGSPLYKREVLFNPFSQKDEWMDSSWESKYLNYNIENNIHCIKSHGIEIKYFDPVSQKERTYIPDFLIKNKTIVEIKGFADQTEMAKFNAAEKWCKSNSYDYKVLSYDKSLNRFLEMGWHNGILGCVEDFQYGSTEVLNWNGISLTSKNIDELDLDIKNQISSDLVEYYLKYGFPYPKLRDETLDLEFEKLKNTNLKVESGNLLPITKLAGNKIVYHFSPQIFSVESKAQKSLIDAFFNKEILKKVIDNRLGITYKERFNITGAMIRQGFSSSRKGFMPSRFNTGIAKFLYDKYTKDGDYVLDYSAGFGQRFLGCMSTNKDLTYIACDPWKDNIDSINNMSQYFNINKNKVYLLNCGSEELDKFNEFYETVSFAFSSPPYFDIEIYDNKNQTQAPSDSYEEFLKWWSKSVSNINLFLKDDGILAFNMVNEAGSREILKDMSDIIIKHGFTKIDEFYMKLSRSHLHKNKSNFKLEPIIIYKKCSK